MSVTRSVYDVTTLLWPTESSPLVQTASDDSSNVYFKLVNLNIQKSCNKLIILGPCALFSVSWFSTVVHGGLEAWCLLNTITELHSLVSLFPNMVSRNAAWISLNLHYCPGGLWTCNPLLPMDLGSQACQCVFSFATVHVVWTSKCEGNGFSGSFSIRYMFTYTSFNLSESTFGYPVSKFQICSLCIDYG